MVYRFLQTVPFRCYGSGLPKEACLCICNFRANRKVSVFGNKCWYFAYFLDIYDKKVDIVERLSAFNRRVLVVP